MIGEIEQKFVKNYIEKNYQERVLYELGSTKKKSERSLAFFS